MADVEEGGRLGCAVGIFFVLLFVFIAYQIVNQVFTYTDDALTRHDARMLERAQDGEAEAQYWFAQYLLTGRQGLDANPWQARRWFESAAAQGHPAATFELGALLRDGEGGERDLPGAVARFTEAARAGSAEAENALGELHLDGEGVDRDDHAALARFRAAAAKGLGAAHRNLAFMMQHGRGTPEDVQGAVREYVLAAQDDDGPAYVALGVLFARGAGPVQPDPKRAWDCLFHAGLMGEPEAKAHRDAVEASMPAEWRSKGLYARELHGCFDGAPMTIPRPRSRVPAR